MVKEKQKIYCSLDIETSGFDPLKNEVLEVGMVFFVIEDGAVKITEEYTKVFKPKGEVQANILALTGISQKELDEAESFDGYKKELQKKLGGSVIVGHNVVFDIKFLQAFGIEFSGEVVDTLDLVQFILPTHHSYNLENLMHSFDISHKDAHRALADSRATLKLLESLIGVYCGFTDELKEQIKTISAGNNLSWAEFLDLDLPVKKISQAPAETKETSANKYPLWNLKGKTIYNFPIGKKCVEDVAYALASGKQKALLVVPKIQQVISLWKEGVVAPVFSPEFRFNEKRFNIFLKRKKLTPDEAKFIMKVLVWRETNWQHECILDLNLSFFGGQFRELINGGDLGEPVAGNVACTDQETFLSFPLKDLYSKRFLVIAGLSEFENNVSQNIGAKVSWGYISYLLKSIYNPELGGKAEIKDAVTKAQSATDLFFGLVGALLSGGEQIFQYIKIADIQNSEAFNKVQKAAENYISKIREINQLLKMNEIGRFTDNLEKFFVEDKAFVKWVELADKRCVFFSSPIRIDKLVRQSLLNYKKVCFADALASEKLIQYFVARLGLEEFAVETISPQAGGQGDLLGLLHKSLKKTKKVKCYCLPETADDKKILSIIEGSHFPAAVLWGSSLPIKQFHDANYQNLKSRAALLVQSNSGGSNKIFHNFEIHKNSLLLATDKFILKNLQNTKNLDPVENLPVKTLVLCHLPFEQYTHPYQEAVSAQFANSFEDYSLPRALYNFQSVVEFFWSPELESIYVIDTKLMKNYAKDFKEYLKSLSNLEMVG